MRDLDWKTMMLAGNEKEMETITEPKNTKERSTRRSCLRNKLLDLFHHKRSEVASKPSLSFAIPKVIKGDENRPLKPKTGSKYSHMEFQNYQKKNLRPIKSLPLHQGHLYSPVKDKPVFLVSVSTQTEPYTPGNIGLVTSEDNHTRTRHWLQGITPSYRSGENIRNKERIEIKNDHHENSDDREDAMLYKQRANIHFHSASDVVCPTTDVDTVDDDTTDTDDSSDDESVNIYEEALNCDDDTYYGYARHPAITQPWQHHSTFHQSYFALPPSYTVVEKKKLSRTTKSNLPPGQHLGQPQVTHHQTEREKAVITKAQSLKKTISSKMSFFHSKNAYNF